MRTTTMMMIALLTISSPAFADTLKSGYPVCVTEDKLNQMYDAMLSNDAPGVDYLLGHGCFETKNGVRVSLLDRSDWGAKAHIRVYAGKDAVEAWTSIGAISSAAQ